MLVHGKEYLCVLGYSACFASEQLHSLSATLAKATQNLRRLAAELSKPQARFAEQGIRNKITRWLSDSFLREVLHYELEKRENRWHLRFQVDQPALQHLWSQRLGRTVLLHQPFGLDRRTGGGPDMPASNRSSVCFAVSRTGNG
jgi:hypothetical protein